MKDKKIRVLCSVVALVSVLAIVPIMFEFFGYENNYYSYYEYGFAFYLSCTINIVIGVFGLVALLWDLVYGAYAVIDGRYRNLTWRIARYGYFYGIVIGFINFALIVSYMVINTVCAFSVIFLLLIAATIVLKFILIFHNKKDN